MVVVAPQRTLPKSRVMMETRYWLLTAKIVGKGLEYVVSKIKGQAGTRVVLTVEREEQPDF